MKSIVLYYSQSGNTKKIARAIHAGMKATGAQADMASIRAVDPAQLSAYDLIGIGGPVINQREPANVADFIEYCLESLDGKHGFAFCTHGALPANYLSRVVPAMSQRGLIMVGWDDWFGGAVYPAIPKPYFTDGHPDKIDLAEAEAFGTAMVTRSQRIYQGEAELIPEFPKGRAYDEIYNPPGFPRVPQEVDKAAGEAFFKFQACMQFKIDANKCRYPQCTHCMDNCPTDSIELAVSPPVFGTTCIKCFLCEQTCPQGAIETDLEGFQRHHDQFVGPVLMKALEGFEDRGKFRRLVPLEQIGWDTPFWRLKKPRFKASR